MFLPIFLNIEKVPSGGRAEIENIKIVQCVTFSISLLPPEGTFQPFIPPKLAEEIILLVQFITDLFTEVHTQNTNTPQGDSLLTRK